MFHPRATNRLAVCMVYFAVSVATASSITCFVGLSTFCQFPMFMYVLQKHVLLKWEVCNSKTSNGSACFCVFVSEETFLVAALVRKTDGSFERIVISDIFGWVKASVL